MDKWDQVTTFIATGAESHGKQHSLSDAGYVESTVNVTLIRTTTEPLVKTKYPIVSVIWKDAHAGDPGWLDMDEYEDDGNALVHTVGFLVPADEPGGKEGHVTLWQTISDGDGIGPFHIPAEMVLETKLLSA